MRKSVVLMEKFKETLNHWAGWTGDPCVPQRWHFSILLLWKSFAKGKYDLPFDWFMIHSLVSSRELYPEG